MKGFTSKFVLGMLCIAYGAMAMAAESQDFIGKVKVVKDGNAEAYSIVGPKNEVIVHPFKGVSEESRKCLLEGKKNGKPVQISSEVDWNEDGTVKILNPKSLACSNRINSDNAFSYYDHCKAEVLGKKSFLGTYLDMEIGDFVHLSFKDKQGKVHDFLADEDAMDKAFKGKINVPAELYVKIERAWMPEGENMEGLGSCFVSEVATGARVIRGLE